MKPLQFVFVHIRLHLKYYHPPSLAAHVSSTSFLFSHSRRLCSGLRPSSRTVVCVVPCLVSRSAFSQIGISVYRLHILGVNNTTSAKFIVYNARCWRECSHAYSVTAYVLPHLRKAAGSNGVGVKVCDEVNEVSPVCVPQFRDIAAGLKISKHSRACTAFFSVG